MQLAVVIYFRRQGQVYEHREVVGPVMPQSLHADQPEMLGAKQVVERKAQEPVVG